MWLYGLQLYVYNGFAKIPTEKNRTFDEKCSTIYPISYILETGGQHYEQRKPDTALDSMPSLQQENGCEDI